MNSDSVAYLSIALICCTLFIVLGFGHCSTSESDEMAKYRICVSKVQDIKECGPVSK